jgi:uncharacterized protein
MRSMTLGVICLTIAAAALTGTFERARGQQTNAQQYGIAAKRPVLGAACKICPWGALGEVVKQSLQIYSYDVQICYNCAVADAPRIVAGAKIPGPIEDVYKNFPMIPRNQSPPPPNAPVDFGVTNAQSVWYAYHGTHAYAGEGPRSNLRLLANIQSPSYLIVAVKSDLGITDLSQVKSKHWPVRILGGAGGEGGAVLAYYGLTKDTIESGGGHLGSGMVPDERKNFDIIVAGGTLGNAPEYNVWYEISQKYDLTYLQLPDDLLDKLAKDYDMQRGMIPDGLLRGIDHPIPTVVRTGTAIYGRSDMQDNFAYIVAKAMDEHQDLLQWSHLNFSYNQRTVWKDYDVPLHSGAARYYRERGYMK